jgi:hypothetical protein
MATVLSQIKARKASAAKTAKKIGRSRAALARHARNVARRKSNGGSGG